MDITVVSCALISFYHTLAGTPTGQKLKSLKLLRVLRPLKTINRVPKLKAVFDCVVISLKNVFNILIVYILFHFIFAVVGVQLFNGKFFYCTDASKHSAVECQGQFFLFAPDQSSPPSVNDREWIQRPFHYDNCFMGMLTLFAVQTSEGWVAILQDSMASTYEEEGPQPWFRVEMSIFYIVYFVVFPFFFINIFVALIIVTFNQLGEAELQDDMDKNQKSCIDFAIQAKPLELYVPDETTGIRYHIWRLVTSTPFENFIMLLIVGNTILLMLKFHGAPEYFTDILSIFNLVFTLLFTIECAFKLLSFGPRNYFKDSWNTFDFITVVGSIVDATRMVSVNFLKLFRAARLIKLLRRSVSVRILLYTFVQSFKALPYVCLLMAMLFFIYAIIGMQLFGSLEMDPTTSIERHNNFRQIFHSLMLLFRCATGEAWPDIMLDATSGRPCDPLALEFNKTTGEMFDPDQNCGSSLTYAYFCSFIFLCSFIMLNLFVAVIMDNFDYLTRDSSILGSHHLGEFITVWSDFDPSGSGKIHYTEVFNMLRNIDPPLGFGKKCPERMAYKKLIRMNMPMDKEGKVHFTTTLFALIRENLKINVRESSEMDQADIELRTTIIKCWPHTKRDKIDLLVPTPKTTGTGHLTVGKLYGGIMIYDTWKQTKFGQIEVLRQQEAELEAMEREEALKEAEESGQPLSGSRFDINKAGGSTGGGGRGDLETYVDNEHGGYNGMEGMSHFRSEYDGGGYQDWGHERHGNGWGNDQYQLSPEYQRQNDSYYHSYETDEMHQQKPLHGRSRQGGSGGDYNSWGHSNTVPQTHRGGRKLPQTPKTPSTLPAHIMNNGPLANNKQPRNSKQLPHFGAIDPRNAGDFKNNNPPVNSSSQPNLFSRFAPTSLLGTKFTKSNEESNSGPTNPHTQGAGGNGINSAFNLTNHSNHHNPSTNNPAGGVGPASGGGPGHRRLPATPNKPSTLFSQTASIAFKNISNQITKPSSLAFRQSNTVALSNSPNYSAFSFPKLNGSPSTRPGNFSGSNGFPNAAAAAHIATTMNGGSGSGFMGFGPTGFTTPIDTVLDRFGRTGTLFPSSMHPGAAGGGGSAGGHPSSQQQQPHGNQFSTNPTGGGIGGIPVGGHPNGIQHNGPHRTLPSMVPFGRSNSLGRSLPPVPSGMGGSGVGAGGGIPSVVAAGGSNITSAKPVPPSTLVRRRTFEDDSDQRMDWI